MVLIAVAASGGCDYFASPDRLVDGDVISIAMVLVAGESHAHLLVGRPFLDKSHPPPKVTASLIGPGWTAAFTHETDPMDGCGGGPTDWPIPMVCLNAALPEPIRERATYELVGKGPKGSFTGRTVVPSAPLILQPDTTVRLPGPVPLLRIPILYRTPYDIGTLRPEVLQTVGDGTGTESTWIRVSPKELITAWQAATVEWGYPPKFRRASLHLLGIGWSYTDFWRLNGNRVPWPSVGISGEGVYGYFDGSTKSRPVEIILSDDG